MARKSHYTIQPETTIELRVLIDNPKPFLGYKTHPAPHMIQQLVVEVPARRTLIDLLLRRPARTKNVVLSRPSTKIVIGHATIYCHPDHIPEISSALTINLTHMIAAANAQHNRKLEAVCQ